MLLYKFIFADNRMHFTDVPI